MNTHNSACFQHLCGNCPCNNNQYKIGIGTHWRTPKKGDKKRWRDFAVVLILANNHFKSLLEEKGITKLMSITDKMLTGRGTYTNYQEHRQSLSNNKHYINKVDPLLKIELMLGKIDSDLERYNEISEINPHIVKELKIYNDNLKRIKKGRKHLEPAELVPYGSPILRQMLIDKHNRETPDIFRK